MSELSTISSDASGVISAVTGVLPVLESALGLAASISNPITLGLTVANAAIKLLPLLQSIQFGGTISVEQQQTIADATARLQAIVATNFNAPEWQARPVEKPHVF